MSVMRRVHTKDFTVLGNDAFNDEALSAEALGLICYLRSKPHDWIVIQGHLASRFKSGRDRIQRIIKELIDLGYIRKVRARDPVTKAWKPVEFVVLDTKAEPLPENTVVASGEPLTENPSMGNPAPAFPALLNTDSLPSTDRPKRPSVSRADFDVWFETTFWPAYPKRYGSNPKKPAADKLFAKIKNGENPEKVLAGIIRYSAEQKMQGNLNTKFVMQATRWINGEGWNDDPVAPAGPGTRTFADISGDLRARAREAEIDEQRSHNQRDADQQAGFDI